MGWPAECSVVAEGAQPVSRREARATGGSEEVLCLQYQNMRSVFTARTRAALSSPRQTTCSGGWPSIHQRFKNVEWPAGPAEE